MISIVDYGMGNLRSVQKALEKLGHDAKFITTPAQVDLATRLILPGVGAFGDAMRGLSDRKLVQPLRDYASSGRPMMGICLGMQILFESSEEDPGIQGLGIISGEVLRFRTRELKVPHMGWNDLTIRPDSQLLRGLGESPCVYFVHSYYVVPKTDTATAAFSEYGERFVAAVELRNVMGTQFHPEKSQETGLQILENFATLKLGASSVH